MCLVQKAFLGASENNANGFVPDLDCHAFPKSLTPSEKKENQVFSAILGGWLHLATGTFGSAALASWNFLTSVFSGGRFRASWCSFCSFRRETTRYIPNFFLLPVPYFFFCGGGVHGCL